MNDTEKSFRNLSEIVQVSEDDIKNNNKNVTAILDLEDIESLKTLLQELNRLKQDNYKLDRENQLLFEKEINFKKEIENEIKELKNKRDLSQFGTGKLIGLQELLERSNL